MKRLKIVSFLEWIKKHFWVTHFFLVDVLINTVGFTENLFLYLLYNWYFVWKYEVALFFMKWLARIYLLNKTMCMGKHRITYLIVHFSPFCNMIISFHKYLWGKLPATKSASITVWLLNCPSLTSWTPNRPPFTVWQPNRPSNTVWRPNRSSLIVWPLNPPSFA